MESSFPYSLPVFSPFLFLGKILLLGSSHFPRLAICSLLRRLYRRCKLDQHCTICSAHKNCLSVQFTMQRPDLYAQKKAAGQEAYGCVVIHPKVKSTLSPGSLLCCAAKPWRKRQRRGLARGPMLRNRMFRVFALGCKAQKWKVALQDQLSRRWLWWCIGCWPGGKMAGAQEVG